MGIQRGLAAVVEADGFGEMFALLPALALLEARVADVDSREGIGRLFHEQLGGRSESVIVIFVQHLGPAEERLRLERTGRERQRLLKRLDGASVVGERDEAPPLLYVRGG